MSAHAMHSSAHGGHSMEHSHHHPYWRLAAMMLASFVAMYVLMYAMVDRLDNVYLNINKAYMAGLMTAPMMVLELALMGSMYPSKKANAALMIGSLVALAALWAAIRTQAAVGDVEFLRSMIPHHSSAILMCNEASVTRPDIRQLCAQIVKSQQEEIDQMKAMLGRER